jgi:arylsulfatase A-like enzyme
LNTNLTRRNFLTSTGLAISSLALRNGLCASENQPKRPNILFFLTDDQRFNAIHALDNAEVQTPNMDKLVGKGVTFTHAHIMGSESGAVCMPSRAMLMTGRSLFHLEKMGQSIPKEHVTLPEQLRKAGYKTFGTGKWHNGREAYARSFTHGGKIFFGGMSDHLQVPVYDFDPDGVYAKEKQYLGDKFSSELFSDEAIQFLKEYNDDAPFLMYVSYTAPHDPRMAPQEYAALYPPDKITLPKNFLPEHPFDNGELQIRDENLAPFPRTPDIIREHIAAYYAMITHLDAQIGRVLQALENSGKAENTIIILAGDNGLAVGQHGLLGKQNLYEHSVRVPLIIAGPNLPEYLKSDALCYLSDIFPTICDLCGITIPDGVEGASLLPVLRGKKEPVRNSIFAAYKDYQRMVRRGDWKLIKYNVNGEQHTQLFHLAKDPWEMNNLAKNPNQARRVQRLTNLLKQWMNEVDDPCNLDHPNWGLTTK